MMPLGAGDANSPIGLWAHTGIVANRRSVRAPCAGDWGHSGYASVCGVAWSRSPRL